MYKTKAREGISQHRKIIRPAESASISQSSKEIVQIPAHQFKAEDFIAGRFRIDDSAEVTRVISIWIESQLGTVTAFGFWQKELFRHARPARGAQAIRQ